MNSANGGSVSFWMTATLFGVGIGLVYALSPLTVVFFAAMWGIFAWARKGLPHDERRWVTALLLVAVLARVLAVALLFLLTDHARVPFGSLFGDEEYFIKRSIWLSNVALGVPIHSADLIYAFDEYSATSYLYVLAFIQALVGPSPYGVHLLGITFYLTGAVVLYRTVRPAFGRTPAFAGLALLLFLPSLFAWSISALKEPLFFLLSAAIVALGAMLVKVRRWSRRLLAAAAAIAIAAAIESVRPAAAALAVAGVIGGLAASGIARRPRVLLAVVVATPIIVGAALSIPTVQGRAYGAVQQAARQHWGHIATPGYVYKLLDDRFYPDRSQIDDLRFGESMRFLVRAMFAYVTVPAPWQVQSRSALAFLPEQMVWYMLIALAPIGVVFGMRRDTVVAGLLLAHAAVFVLSVAVISGNVGTLVRHRGLALPYLVWFSALAACELLSRCFAAGSSREVAEPVTS